MLVWMMPENQRSAVFDLFGGRQRAFVFNPKEQSVELCTGGFCTITPCQLQYAISRHALLASDSRCYLSSVRETFYAHLHPIVQALHEAERLWAMENDEEIVCQQVQMLLFGPLQCDESIRTRAYHWTLRVGLFLTQGGTRESWTLDPVVPASTMADAATIVQESLFGSVRG
jgi:hypothetical protein